MSIKFNNWFFNGSKLLTVLYNKVKKLTLKVESCQTADLCPFFGPEIRLKNHLSRLKK